MGRDSRGWSTVLRGRVRGRDRRGNGCEGVLRYISDLLPLSAREDLDMSITRLV